MMRFVQRSTASIPLYRVLGIIGLALLGASGCAGRKKPVDQLILSPEQGYERAMDLLAQRKLRNAIDALGKVDLASLENRREMEPKIRLALADATFYQGNDLGLIDARSLYLDFVTLYSSHSAAPYAQFQAGMCSLAQVSHPSKDQSMTRAAIATLGEVERRFGTSAWAGVARLMRQKAESSLAEHEFLIGRFYMKKKSYVAAADRFRHVLDSSPPYYERDKIYYHLGQALVLGENTAEGRIYLDKLVTDFPNGRWAGQARKILGDGATETDFEFSP